MSSLKLAWSQLSYEVCADGANSSSSKRQILQCQDGHIATGTLTAVLGPSGAGKTTLVNCISGRVTKGVRGRVLVESSLRKVKLTVVPQKDALFGLFNVFESLLFASRVQNNCSSSEHVKKVVNVLEALDLRQCSKTKVSKLSGGERKRLAIGLETISNPDILLLDEPTTGLDSANASKCIKLISELAIKRSMAVLAIVHQPNSDILNSFDAIYLMSSWGERVFFGPPGKVVGHFEASGIRCPRKSSIAAFALKVVSREDVKAIKDSEDVNENKIGTNSKEGTVQKGRPISELVKNFAGNSSSHVWTLVKRELKSPFLVFFLVLNSLVTVQLANLLIRPIGLEDGCRLEQNSTLNLEQARQRSLLKMETIRDATFCVQSVNLFLFSMNMVWGIMYIPYQMSVIRREVSNGWYTTESFLMSKVAAGAVDISLNVGAIFAIFYTFTDQNLDIWRSVSWYLAWTLVASVGWSAGLVIGVLFRKSVKNGIIVDLFVVFTSMLLSSLMVKKSEITSFFVPFVYLNVLERSLRLIFGLIFGFGRCSMSLDFAAHALDGLAAQTPFQIAHEAVRTFNVTDEDIDKWAPVFGVPSSVVKDILRAGQSYFEASSANSSTGRTAQPSQLLDFYEIADDGHVIWFDFLLLASYATVLIFFAHRLLIRALK